MARVYFMLLSVIFINVYVTEQAYFLEEDYINKINEQATTWKVSLRLFLNFFLSCKELCKSNNLIKFKIKNSL